MENIITTALAESKENLLSEIEFAKLCGFTENELNMVKIFWNPTFNGSWIYLSDEIILGQLTNEVGKNSIYHFYERIMIPNYEEFTDYKKVDTNHELIKEYIECHSPKKGKLDGTRKKFYIVSGETYKCMLLTSASIQGKITRKYYMKVEMLANKMKDYIFNFHKIQSETYKQNLKTQSMSLKNLEKTHNDLKVRKTREKFEPGNCVYIISHKPTSWFHNDHYYKTGIATQKKSEEISAFTKRLSCFNTHSPDDYTVHYIIYTKHNKNIEDDVKIKFSEHFKPSNKEWIKSISLDVILNFIVESMKLKNILYRICKIEDPIFSATMKQPITFEDRSISREIETKHIIEHICENVTEKEPILEQKESIPETKERELVFNNTLPQVIRQNIGKISNEVISKFIENRNIKRTRYSSGSTKKCSSCTEILSTLDFNKNKALSTGIDTYCKFCSTVIKNAKKNSGIYKALRHETLKPVLKPGERFCTICKTIFISTNTRLSYYCRQCDSKKRQENRKNKMNL